MIINTAMVFHILWLSWVYKLAINHKYYSIVFLASRISWLFSLSFLRILLFKIDDILCEKKDSNLLKIYKFFSFIIGFSLDYLVYSFLNYGLFLQGRKKFTKKQIIFSFFFFWITWVISHYFLFISRLFVVWMIFILWSMINVFIDYRREITLLKKSDLSSFNILYKFIFIDGASRIERSALSHRFKIYKLYDSVYFPGFNILLKDYFARVSWTVWFCYKKNTIFSLFSFMSIDKFVIFMLEMKIVCYGLSLEKLIKHIKIYIETYNLEGELVRNILSHFYNDKESFKILKRFSGID